MKQNIDSYKKYKEIYEESISDPENFGKKKLNLFWHKKWNKVLSWNFNKPEIKWFEGGKLNITENCLDETLTKK